MMSRQLSFLAVAVAKVVFIHTGGWPALFAPNGYPFPTERTILSETH